MASSLPAQPTVILSAPSQEYIEKEELDVDLLPLEQVHLDITDRAAEVSCRPFLMRMFFSLILPKQLTKISQREQNPDAALRIAVESGGCHGYQYKMELAKSRSPDD